MLAAFRENGAPNSSRSTSGNSSATSSAINVPSTHTSTSTGCRSSSSTGSVTVPSFLSTYSTNGIPVVIRGPSCFSAARPGFVGTILVRFFLGTVDQQPDLGTFGRESVCSWLPLRANPGETGGQITSGTFVELEDLLAENIRAQERIVALGLFWTSRGSEDSEETWATFCTLWSREVRF